MISERAKRGWVLAQGIRREISAMRRWEWATDRRLLRWVSFEIWMSLLKTGPDRWTMKNTIVEP